MNDDEPVFCLGRRVDNGEELIIPRDKVVHIDCRGITRCGKTSLTLVPLAKQAMRPYRDKATGEIRCDAVVIFDLAGDSNFQHNVVNEARALVRGVKQFCLDTDLASDCFPPFQALPSGERNVVAMSQMFVKAFHLDHGLDYGGKYYTDCATTALLGVSRDAGARSFPEVGKFLRAPANRKRFKDAEDVAMTVDFLSEYWQFSHAPDPRDDILMDAVLEKKQVVYSRNPTLTHPMTARYAAGLQLQTLLTVAERRIKDGKEPVIVWVFIDEFQELVGRSASALFAQSAKFGLRICAAYQSTSQLRTRDLSLADQVFEGCQLHQYYTCIGERDVEQLQSLSKDKLKTLGGYSASGLSVSNTARDIIVPILERDEILDCTYTFGHSFVVLNDGEGHHEPVRIEAVHDYQDLSNVPLPKRSEPFPAGNGSIAANGRRSGKSRRKPPPLDSPERGRRHEALTKLLDAKRAAERWEET